MFDEDPYDDTYGTDDSIWQPETDPPEEIFAREALQNLPKIPALRPSQFTSFAFRMPAEDGQVADDRGYAPFSFEGRRHMRRIYDSSAKRIILKSARQCEKSTLLGNIALNYMCLVQAYKVLYVNSSATQAKTFSNDRVKEPIETSPILRRFTTTMLSSNILEKQFVNRSKMTMRYAYLNADRCIAGTTRVQLADGSWMTIREMAESVTMEWDVIAADLMGQPQRAVAVRARSTGIRKLVRVVTDYPVDLFCTADHRLMTARGWVEAEALQDGDFIAAPHCAQLLSGEAIGEDMAWVIGALMAEGQCIDSVIRFSNTDEDFIQEFTERAERLGLRVGKLTIDTRHNKYCYTIGVCADTRGPGLQGNKAHLWELGEFGARSYGKKIPAAIWRAPALEKFAFLHALFRGDGWCCPESGFGRAGYCTSSSQLAEDLCHLLWSFGVRCALREKPPSTDVAHVSYTLDFSTTDTARLVTLIGAFRDGLVYRSSAGKSSKDRIPISYEWLKQYLRTTYGLSTHTAWMNHQIQLRPGNRRDSIGRRVLCDIASKLNDPYLHTLASERTSWVQVHAVYPQRQEEEVFDLEVPGLESFIANGIVVHNCRGIPAFLLEIDEFQDILSDNIPVIEQCLAHAPEKYKRFIYAGTPKSLDNSIEGYWSKYSTQNEWVVPHDCQIGGAGRFWNILGEKNIGKKGLICEKCGKLLDAMHADSQWAAMVRMNPPRISFEGYRINQLMVPWKPWNEILLDYERYARDRFYNEVLGISYDSGLRPLTRTQVQECCNPHLMMSEIEQYRELSKSQFIYAGIDWGSGENSYTVICLGTWIKGKFRCFYWHRFTGEEVDPPIQLERICELLTYFNVEVIGTDYGGGFHPNDHLMRKFGPRKLHKFQYLARSRRKVVYDGGLGRWKAARTEVMSDVFNAVKRGKIEFPRWEEFENPHGQDMLNIFSEYNEQLRMVQYKHAIDSPDDSFHALTYCLLASMLRQPRPDIITPTQEVNGQPVPRFKDGQWQG